MRLSLILPTYNCAGYLRETLASVLDRITEEYEVIVIDDGSDDETALCLGEFEGISEQIQIHYLSHSSFQGPAYKSHSASFQTS